VVLTWVALCWVTHHKRVIIEVSWPAVKGHSDGLVTADGFTTEVPGVGVLVAVVVVAAVAVVTIVIPSVY
jgi:hypothetical protein